MTGWKKNPSIWIPFGRTTLASIPPFYSIKQGVLWNLHLRIYCWWFRNPIPKQPPNLDVFWNPVKNGIFTISTGAGFRLSTVSPNNSLVIFQPVIWVFRVVKNQLSSQASEEKRMPDLASWDGYFCLLVCLLGFATHPPTVICGTGFTVIHCDGALKRSCVAIRADAFQQTGRSFQENPVIFFQSFPGWLIETPYKSCI